MDVKKVLSDLEFRHPGEPEYLQAVKEFLLAQDENAEEIDGSPFTAKAVISNEIANKWNRRAVMPDD